jgi:putative serine protease PepD
MTTATPRDSTNRSLWTDRPDDWDEAVDGPPPPPPRPPAARRSRRPLAAALAVTALAVTGAGAYAVGSAHDPAVSASPAVETAIAPTPKTDIGKVYARVSAGVVSIRVGSGSGTGFVIDRQGTIVTNDHVVGNATTAQVRFGDNDALVSAKVVGTDPSSDLAVLRVDPKDVGTLKPLTFASSKDVAVGDTAIAIGYPLGLDRTATAGIISGLGREIEAPNGYRIDEVLQTDAPINPGNSGGPLLDSQGHVIGINSQIATAGGGSGSVGIGFAVPSDTVREVVPKLLKGETISRPYLGISSGPAPSGNGAQVQAVTAGSPAQSAGVRAGDIITRIGGQAISDPDAVANAIADRKPGDRVTIELTRGGSKQTLQVTLGTRPDSAP